jgi:hypothetical protein
MKLFKLKYLFVFLFTVSVFHLTGAECDEDDNPVAGINEAALGKWTSTSFPGETQYLYITTDSISVWIKEDGSSCYDLEFSANYTATSSSLTITVPGEGTQIVTYTVSGTTMTVIAPDGEGGTDNIVFTKTDFDPSTFIICVDLEGTWQNNTEPTEYLKIVDEDTYEIWNDLGSCYEKYVTDSYTFDQVTKTGIAQIGDAVGGEGDITYNEGNNTITVTYTPVQQPASGQLEIIPEESYTYSSVTDIDFYSNECSN